MTTLLKRLVPTGTDGLLNAPVLISFAMLVLVVHALFVDVVIHPFFFTVYCIAPLLIPGAALAMLAAHRNARRKTWARAGVSGFFGLLVLPFLGLAIFWVVFAKTPAWTGALLFGTPHSEVREFDIRRPGGKGCTYRAEVVDDLRLYPAYLCVSGAYASRDDRQRVQLRLVGDRTALGFRITDIQHQDALGPAPARRDP